jgi:malonyl-CoA/methylmalonyl-CoA synthetase
VDAGGPIRFDLVDASGPSGAGDEDLLAEGTLPAAWSARWRERPDDPAVGQVGSGWMTNAELDGVTARGASRLRELGLAPGDRIIVSGATNVELVLVHVAALRAGLTVIPVNPALTRAEFDALLEAARPRAVVASGDMELADDHDLVYWTLEWSWQGGQLLAYENSVGGFVDALTSTSTSPDAEWWVRPPDQTIELDAARPDQVALLAFTSGTTGRPKGVPLTHANLLSGAEALRRAWGWTPDDRLLLSLPLFHMHGLGVGVHGTLLAGASAALFERFDPEQILEAASRPESTLFFGVPTMYSRLVDAPGVERLRHLRLCVSGSAPLSADLHQRIRQATGQVVLERYGMTETVMLTSNPLDPADGERRPGTVGRPLPGVDLRLDPGTDEIQVRGPNVFGGYLDRPGASSSDPDAGAFTDDGWFRTGDIGQLDVDGYLSIIGRAKDLIITGGYNVYPSEIEAVVRGCPGVADAAVAGIASDEWGEIVGAWIELEPDADPALVVDRVGPWCADRLAPYKRPRQIQVVDALPRNALGKIQRDQLS